MSTISASTTSTTAYKVTADTTGALVLQTGATPTTAMTIDTSQNTTLAGTLATSSRGIAKASMPAGSVLQVVQFTTQTPFSTTSGTAVSTGFSATITPTSSTSKVLVLAYSTLGVPTSGMNGHIDLRRGTSTTIATDFYVTYGAAAFLNAGFTGVYLDSPATTSATTYYLYTYRDGAAGTFYVGARNDGGSPVLTSITLMEIAA